MYQAGYAFSSRTNCTW